MNQLCLDFSNYDQCCHATQFNTMAVVPAGLYCPSCKQLTVQWLPRTPDQIGYISADWAWKHIHGKEYFS